MPMPPTNKSLITKARSLSASMKRCNLSQITLLLVLVIKNQQSAQASSCHLLTLSAKRDDMMRLHRQTSQCIGQLMVTQVHHPNLPKTPLCKDRKKSLSQLLLQVTSKCSLSLKILLKTSLLKRSRQLLVMLHSQTRLRTLRRTGAVSSNRTWT